MTATQRQQRCRYLRKLRREEAAAQAAYDADPMITAEERAFMAPFRFTVDDLAELTDFRPKPRTRRRRALRAS